MCSSDLGIEGGAALHFIDENPEYAVRFAANKNAYQVTLQEAQVSESAYTLRDLNS